MTPHITVNIASIAPDVDYAVMEIALFLEATVRDSSQIARPNVGVITSIGIKHPESFDEPYHGILQSKTDILRHLSPGGIAVLPEFSDRYDELLYEAKNCENVDRVITCGTGEGIKPRQVHWSDPILKRELEETLMFLCGDRFDFTFVGMAEQELGPTPYFNFGAASSWNPDRVLMFSGGLDLFAGALEEIRVRTHNQNMTVSVRAIADRKTLVHRS